MSSPSPGPAHFDEWYSELQASPSHNDLARQTLGLPAEIESTSLLPWDGIADLVDALAVGPGDVLVDLGCGRGGYGLEIAARTGARLIGVDFSAVAIGRARERAGDRGEFRVGELTATGLPTASAAAIMCVDAMQFADPYRAGIAECRRVLVPGGRLVLTGWQAEADDDGLPARLRHDIAAELAEGGFEDVTVTDMPAWRAAEEAHWAAAVATDPAGDPAVAGWREEGESVLPWLARTRRVLARARVPAAS